MCTIWNYVKSASMIPSRPLTFRKGSRCLVEPLFESKFIWSYIHVRSTAGTLRPCAKHAYRQHDSDAQYFISWSDHRKISNKLEANCICSVSKNKSTPQNNLKNWCHIVCVMTNLTASIPPNSSLIRSDIILNVAAPSSSVWSVSAGHAGCPSLIPTSGTFLHWYLIVKTFVQPFSHFRWFKKSICQLLEKNLE